jgi:hypothetical protein
MAPNSNCVYALRFLRRLPSPLSAVSLQAKFPPRVACLEYVGPLAGLISAWARFHPWIRAQEKLSALPKFDETYTVGWADTSEQEKHTTQLNRFVALQQ